MLSYKLACSLVLREFPQIKPSSLPKLQFHPTLKVALAYCYFDKNKIVVSKKHYEKNKSVFANEVFLHELAHFVANKLYGCRSHGKAWKSVCKQLDIIPRLNIEVDF